MKNKGFVILPDLNSSEEDGGFGVEGEKTRYATLQRQRGSNNDEYDSLRALRNNISSLVSVWHFYL